MNRKRQHQNDKTDNHKLITRRSMIEMLEGRRLMSTVAPTWPEPMDAVASNDDTAQIAAPVADYARSEMPSFFGTGLRALVSTSDDAPAIARPFGFRFRPDMESIADSTSDSTGVVGNAGVASVSARADAASPSTLSTSGTGTSVAAPNGSDESTEGDVQTATADEAKAPASDTVSSVNATTGDAPLIPAAVAQSASVAMSRVEVLSDAWPVTSAALSGASPFSLVPIAAPSSGSIISHDIGQPIMVSHEPQILTSLANVSGIDTANASWFTTAESAVFGSVTRSFSSVEGALASVGVPSWGSVGGIALAGVVAAWWFTEPGAEQSDGTEPAIDNARSNIITLWSERRFGF